MKDFLKNQDANSLGILERRGAQREGDSENAGDERIYEREISQCHKPCPICIVQPPTLTSLILHHFLLFVLSLLVLLPFIDLVFHAGPMWREE